MYAIQLKRNNEWKTIFLGPFPHRGSHCHYRATFFDSKAEAQDLIDRLGVPDDPTLPVHFEIRPVRTTWLRLHGSFNRRRDWTAIYRRNGKIYVQPGGGDQPYYLVPSDRWQEVISIVDNTGLYQVAQALGAVPAPYFDAFTMHPGDLGP